MTDTDKGMNVADVFAAAHVRAEHALGPHREAAGDERLARWFDGFEDEIRAVAAPLIESFLHSPDTPDEVKPLLAIAVAPEKDLQVGILFAILGALAFPLVQAMEAANVTDIQQQSFSGRPHVALPPAEIALGAVRHTLGSIDPDTEGAKSGYDKDRMNVLTLNTGDSPAIGDLLLLYRRKQIDHARLVHGLQQSRTRDEWVDDIINLRFAPPSAGEVITGALKGHLTDADAREKLAVAGIDPDNFDWLRATAGRPPGIEQVLHLRNRKQATAQDVVDVVRQSDINDRFLPLIEHLGEYHPPVRSIMAMLRAGAIDDTKATELFKNQGVLDTDIPGYLREAHHGRTASVKTLSQSQVVRMYTDGLMDHATATARLETLGYNAGDSDLLLALADDTRHERYVNALISQMHSRYVAHKATDADVHNALSAAGIDGATITELLRLWQLARGAAVHAPTVAQVVHAYRATYISAASCKRLLLAAGVTADDIGITVAAGFPPVPSHRPQIDAVVNA